MADHFSIIDVRIIQSLLDKKPVAYIAMIIDKPEDLVAKKIMEVICGSSRISFDNKKNNESIRKRAQKINDNIFNDSIRKVKRASRKGQIQKVEHTKYATRAVDYSKTILVKIDSKTYIHVPIGSDVEEEKNKFLKNHKPSVTVSDNPWTKISKFK